MSTNTESTIIEILKRYIDEDKISPSLITLETCLDDLGIDSTDRLEIMFDVEEAFDIEIPNSNEVDGVDINFVTAQDIINAVAIITEQEEA